MKTKIMIITGIVAVFGFLFIYKAFAEYSSSPASSTGLCYSEDWKASEFFVLQQKKAGPDFEFSYVNAGTSDPRNVPVQGGGDALLSDFVPTKWEVTGSVSFKSEE